jgi:hypothetical protein
MTQPSKRPATKRAQLFAEAEALERKLAALEEPRTTEVWLGFDPGQRPGGPMVEKRVGDDGEPYWAVQVVIT